MLKKFSLLCLASASFAGLGLPSQGLAQQVAYYAERQPPQAGYVSSRNRGGLIEALFGDGQPAAPRYQVQQGAVQRQRVYQAPQYEPRYQQEREQPQPQQPPQVVYMPPPGFPFPMLPQVQPQPQPQREPQVAMRQPSSDMGEPARPAFDPKFEKQVVEYQGGEAPGTVIVDTPNKFLFLVQGNGRALRYGIGVGRPGFTWRGVKSITAKKEWPSWTPPAEMLARRPDLPRFMEGGPDNPLGARAMYLGSTLYRIHGSNEPWTIGTNVSSGCFRMRNEDVIDLYSRVNVGAKVIVL
jgi:lipoprotein-anchoring transpeptidase ErfK/SrfK